MNDYWEVLPAQERQLCSSADVLNCSVGHPWRYSELMIEYHYTNERHALLQAVKFARAQAQRGSLDL